MKAAILREEGTPLRLEDLPVPVPRQDEVLIRVEASGVCHSDLHLIDGDWAQIKRIFRLPRIPGHEIVGRIEAVGDSVSIHAAGDRVGVPWIYSACAVCDFCNDGYENLCSRQQITGVHVDGGYAEYVVAKADFATPVPASLDSIEAAPLFCAGLTVYRAINKARVSEGQRVAVFGIGGLGHLAVQILASLGAEVIAVDLTQDKLELAASLGAARTLDAKDGADRILRSEGGVHVAIVTSAARAAYDSALRSLRPTGTLAVVGMPAEPICFPAITLIGNEYRVVASAVGTRQDLREVLSLAETGKIRCKVETSRLDEINEVFDRMRRGTITGRVVLDLA